MYGQTTKTKTNNIFIPVGMVGYWWHFLLLPNYVVDTSVICQYYSSHYPTNKFLFSPGKSHTVLFSLLIRVGTKTISAKISIHLFEFHIVVTFSQNNNTFEILFQFYLESRLGREYLLQLWIAAYRNKAKIRDFYNLSYEWYIIL